MPFIVIDNLYKINKFSSNHAGNAHVMKADSKTALKFKFNQITKVISLMIRGLVLQVRRLTETSGILPNFS